MGLQNSTSDSPPSYQTFGAALRSVPDWLIDISTADQDDVRLAVWLIVVLVTLVLAATLPEASKVSRVGARQLSDVSPLEPRLLRGRVVVGLVVPLSLIAYVTLPTASGFIWPICQRFPLIAALFVVPLLGRAPALARAFAAVVSIALALLATVQYSQLFRQVEAIAYRGFDNVVGRIPLGSRVATLVFDRNVDGLRLSPLMHAAGWVQAERGGMVMFTFAEFPPSPFSYRPSRRPPQVPPRWEWVPDRVRPDRDLGWYDFVLVHGWTGSLEASRRFVSVFGEGRWSLWRRADSARALP
jgi:hypothetical protein